MKKKKKKVNAAILIIGNEILSGRTQDKNISFISNWLNLNCGISEVGCNSLAISFVKSIFIYS